MLCNEYRPTHAGVNNIMMAGIIHKFRYDVLICLRWNFVNNRLAASVGDDDRDGELLILPILPLLLLLLPSSFLSLTLLL